jgi:hypothetical protein
MKVLENEKGTDSIRYICFCANVFYIYNKLSVYMNLVFLLISFIVKKYAICSIDLSCDKKAKIDLFYCYN